MSSTMSTQSFRDEAYMSVLRGFKELDFQGDAVPCELVLAGENAFPLVMNSKDHILMAASVYGRGRIVALAHEAYLTKFPALVDNVVNWLRGDQSANLVCVQKDIKAVADGMTKSTYKVKTVEAFAESQGAAVYVTNAYNVDDPKALVAFLKAGGGVFVAGQASHWASQNPNKNVFLEFPGNKVSAVAGIYFTKEYGEALMVPIPPKIPTSLKAIGVCKSFEEDLEPLLKGITQFFIPDDVTPSEVFAHGRLAFPIGVTEDGQAFIAGGYYGKGRVIVTSHEFLLKMEKWTTFWNNAICWLDQGRQGVVGVVPDIHKFSKFGKKCEATRFRNDLSVFVCTVYGENSAQKIQEFVAEGGGLLIGGHAWWWASTHPGQNPITGVTGNQILNKMGLTILKDTIGSGVYEPPSLTQRKDKILPFRSLLQSFLGYVLQGDELTEDMEDQQERMKKELEMLFQIERLEDSTPVMSLMLDMLKQVGMPQVSENNPIKSKKEHLLLFFGHQLFKVTRDPDALLPYLIKDIPQLPLVHNQRITINAKTAERSEWISTGLYLSPGMKTNITFSAPMVNKNFWLQIGCQTDYLKHRTLKRAPVVYERFLVTSERMQVSNLWGGLIYVVVPHDTLLKGGEIIVESAVSAPYYKCGVTTEEDWLVQRAAPAPWAELEFDNIILSVPSEAVRDVKNLDKLAALWNDLMRYVAELAAIPTKFTRKERIVADVQISIGWLHSGYPIMSHSSGAHSLFQHEKPRSKLSLWGVTHELGHNQQKLCWEFKPHTTEATCNLWSVYVNEKLTGVDKAEFYSPLSSQQRTSVIEQYVHEGQNLNSWNVFTALETYLQLQERFGWGAFKKVFAAYQTMDQYPEDNNGKMNLYAETFSQTVGMNLTEFFKAWGWPIDRATERKLHSLPSWEDHPMVQYI